MTPVAPGRHDPVEWRQAKRSGREAGCWAYIAAEQLAAAGIDPHGPAPVYKLYALAETKKGKGRFMLNVKVVS